MLSPIFEDCRKESDEIMTGSAVSVHEFSSGSKSSVVNVLPIICKPLRQTPTNVFKSNMDYRNCSRNSNKNMTKNAYQTSVIQYRLFIQGKSDHELHCIYRAFRQNMFERNVISFLRDTYIKKSKYLILLFTQDDNYSVPAHCTCNSYNMSTCT